MNVDLTGHVAIVTGAGSGIGQATALALARQGARVTVADNISDRVYATEEAIAGACKHRADYRSPLGLVVDVRIEDDVSNMVSRTISQFGQLDILVASAGILRARDSRPKLLCETTVPEWDEVIDTNLKGVFLSNQKALAAMIPRKRGTIINISSISGREARAYDAAYCASKFGIIGMSESLAEEVSQHNIRVMTILPHATRTPLWAQNGPIGAPQLALSPERVAEFIVYALKLPEDTVLVNSVIAPFRARRRKASQ